jgi:hypothetical protein
MWGLTARGFVQVPRFYLLAVPGLRDYVPWSLVEEAYLASIARADAKVGALLIALERSGELDRTMVVVTADHGQSFGEGGNVYHGCGATDSVLRVPLVVRLPPTVARIPCVDRWVSLCEIPSWLKSMALGREPYGPDGLSPIPFPAKPLPPEPVLAEGGPASDPNYSLGGIGLDHRWNHRLIAAFAGNQKWVYDTLTGDAWVWKYTDDIDDSDRLPADHLEEPEKSRVLRAVFRIEGAEGAARYGMGAGPIERPPLGDARMRSWGYD